MAKTAVINRRRKRSSKRRRRNYGAAASVANPRRRRRRRRSYGAAAPRRRRGRRRNPASPYSSTGYRREPNPFGNMFGLSQLFEIVPAGTVGVMGARFALRQVAAMAPGAQPGIWQAIAIWLGSNVTGALVSSLFKSPSKGLYAKIAGLSFGGDLFTRTRLLANSDWARNNLSLAGMGDDEDSTEYYDEGLIDGFQPQSALGEEFTDAGGNTWQATDRGWALAGVGADGGPGLYQAPDGQVYQMNGLGLDSGPGSGSRLAGFQPQSALGATRAYHNPNSSFGYSP